MNPTDQDILISLQDLTQDYGDGFIFQNINYDLPRGKHLALLGPSGCGKSTLLRLICGLTPPTEGKITLLGKRASETNRVITPPHQRGVGMVFQELALWPNLSALENVLLGIPNNGKTKNQRLILAKDAIHSCQLNGLEHRKPAELSVGQQQRVALARALAPRPTILLLDEPFTGLDLTLKAEIFTEIRQLVIAYNLTIILVTHEPTEALALTENALILEDGAIKEQGSLNKLLKNPTSTTLKAFNAQ